MFYALSTNKEEEVARKIMDAITSGKFSHQNEAALCLGDFGLSALFALPYLFTVILYYYFFCLSNFTYKT